MSTPTKILQKLPRTLSINQIVEKMLSSSDCLLEKREMGKELLAQYDYKSGDWKKYAFFEMPRFAGAKPKYTRNLVYEDESCRLLILCWLKGVVTPMHNHPEGGCWVTMLNGNLTEVTFDPSLKQNGENNLLPGGITWMHDSIGYHKIGNFTSKPAVSMQIGNFTSKPAVSMHLYSPRTLSSVVYNEAGDPKEVG
eukprot:CAMPEP_0114992068 /NCGR_PEP_ID=MMETSP0216-20121206/11733_1 /TAXON_ID=223996 /ORGANISM="Protocruzia adherens, Strain Boccale" /LENGTH=194 /DNA_ID=CAMNT_0002355487 /DNA_START=96 /DNA_END=676 /DNA_ORIENTATION=+